MARFRVEKKIWILLMILLLTVIPLLAACGGGTSDDSGEDSNGDSNGGSGGNETKIEREGTYDSKDDVKDYLVEYGQLPSNYITKNEARKLGWKGGSVEQVAEGKCIGGDRFGNYEKNLPQESDRDFYHECDIDTLGKESRGAKRIIYAKDGDIYYTEDHYDSFEKIYDAD